MTRTPSLSHPFLLGFDDIERALDRVAKGASEGYPPYNIERMPRTEDEPDRLRITLAVAGFAREQLEITLEENQLTIRGRQGDDKNRQFLHRGIAARQFQRSFLLADGMQVLGAGEGQGRFAPEADIDRQPESRPKAGTQERRRVHCTACCPRRVADRSTRGSPPR